jgi:hypothetical protein
LEELLLILRGTPATVDDEPDAVVRGPGGSVAQGSKERWIKIGHTGNGVVEDRRAVGEGAVSLAQETARQQGHPGRTAYAEVCRGLAEARDLNR